MHVQVLCTHCSFVAPTGRTVGTADAKLASHIYTGSTCVPLWLPFLWCADCARQDRTSLFERGLLVLGNFVLSTPKLVH